MRSLLFFLGVLAGALPLAAQSFEWRDARGTRHTSSRLDEVPAQSRETMTVIAKVTKVESGEVIQIQGGFRLRMLGLDAPDAQGRSTKQAHALRDRLRTLMGTKPLRFELCGLPKDDEWRPFVIARPKSGPSINAAILGEGLCPLLLPAGVRHHGRALVQAADKARREKKGIWSRQPKTTTHSTELPFHGFSLGLYSSTKGFDYGPFLDEMVAMGCRDVLLITPWFLKDYQANILAPKRGRSISLDELKTVIAQANKRKLRVSLMPIVLLEDGGTDYWRGNIEPSRPANWFLNYQEFMGRFADCAREAGAETLVIGSELSSMEKYEGQWRAIAQGMRRRFPGRLSYSANWDHISVIKWWDLIDIVGMTGYHKLSEVNDPTVGTLTAAWCRIREELFKTVRPLGKPFFFTEVGYCSVDGANTKPWDYVSLDDPDEKEQADCYQAFVNAWRGLKSPYHGVMFYTWWRNGDSSDRTSYSVKDKPAEKIVRDFFKKP